LDIVFHFLFTFTPTHTLRNDLSRIASDHLPLVTTLRLE